MCALKNGTKWVKGVNSVEILDQDRLCYQVKSVSNGAVGIRTISKALLKE